jgi:hypothetical protein
MRSEVKMSKHIDLTSQLDRHKLLMDLAAATKAQTDKHPEHYPDYESGAAQDHSVPPFGKST